MMQKIAICAPSHNFVGLYLRNYGTYRQSKKLVKQQYLPHTCRYNMVNFGPLAAEIVSLVGAPEQISTGFASWQRYCTAKLRRWTEGATCMRQGGHHVGHWPTFLVAAAVHIEHWYSELAYRSWSKTYDDEGATRREGDVQQLSIVRRRQSVSLSAAAATHWRVNVTASSPRHDWYVHVLCSEVLAVESVNDDR